MKTPAPLLAAALLALLLPASPAARAQEAPPPPPAKPEEKSADQVLIEKLVVEAAPLVEKARGLSFKAKVGAEPVTMEKFLDRYMLDFDRMIGGEAKGAAAGRLLARLGIMEKGTDIRAILAKFLEGNIAANYDPATKGISFLPGASRTIPLMVHELTHALDDQHFDMTAQMKGWDGHIDRMLAYGALAEGDAESVEYRFMTGGAIAEQPLEGLRAMADAMAAAIMQGKFGKTPPGIALAFKSQYLEGLLFAETLRRTEKGEEAVNAAFRAPPASTEQILHPEKFLAGEGPVVLAMAAPPEGAKFAMETTLGELATRIVLLSCGVPKEEAAAAAAGWGGDVVSLLARGEGEALIWVTRWDTEADAVQFGAAARKAFPEVTGEGAPARTFVVRGPRVEYVEAPLDAHPPARKAAQEAE